MNTNAAGQLLGYSLQFPRALFHLLTCDTDDSVCIEVLGDVATIHSNGTVTAEEDKSSIVSNPVTDRSTDLWKTFNNWILACNEGTLDIGRTKFLLYSNHDGRSGIAGKLSGISSEIEAYQAIDELKSALMDIKSDHSIWKYYDYVINQNPNLFVKLIVRYEIQVGSGSGFHEVRNEIRKKHVPSGQIEYTLEKLSGWLQKTVIEKLSRQEQAIISWSEFDDEFLVHYDRARSRELIDFTIHINYEKKEIYDEIKGAPKYLKQLEKIEIDGDEVIEAVTDYLRADMNREKWIEAEIINEDVAAEFEESLKTFWASHRVRINITNGNLDEIKKGHLLFLDCKLQKIQIRNMVPPSSTIPGTYHALADDLELGWHPNWEEIFLGKR